MPAPRPKRLTPGMALLAGREIAAALAANGHIDGPDEDIERCASDIARSASRGMDGYQIARALETHCGWVCNLEMAEELDGFHYAAQKFLDEAEAQWVIEENIEPPFPVNTAVRLDTGETGEITEIDKARAKYHIAIDGDPEASGPHRARRVVNFESVSLIALLPTPTQS